VVFDACVNTDPLERAEKDSDFKLFLIELALQWIEERHDYLLSRGTIIIFSYKITYARSLEFSLLRMKCKGQLVKHFIRRQPKPFIADAASKASVDQTLSATSQKKPEIIVKEDSAIDDSELRNVSSRRLKTSSSPPVAEKAVEVEKQPEYEIQEESGEAGEVEFLILTVQLPELASFYINLYSNPY
jgi:hypothetical protein